MVKRRPTDALVADALASARYAEEKAKSAGTLALRREWLEIAQEFKREAEEAISAKARKGPARQSN
jgi:hypothetical protein